MLTDSPGQEPSAPSSTEEAENSMTTAPAAVERLLEVIAQLREHCPWMAALTHESVVKYLIEEAYETVEAVETGAEPAEFAGELGDLLLQVVLHSQISRESGHFDFADVATGLTEKMIRRNPHVFAPDGSLRSSFPATVAEIEQRWEQVKSAEKPGRALAEGIPRALPALQQAQKLLERRRRAGLEPEAKQFSLSEGSPLSAQEVGEQILHILRRAEAVDAEQAVRSALRELGLDEMSPETRLGESDSEARPTPLFEASGVVFRRAGRADVPRIRGLLEDDFIGSGRENSGAGAEAMAPYLQAWADVDGDPRQLLVIGERGSDAVATFQLSFIPGLSRTGMQRAQIEAVRIAQTERGSGLGTAMIRWGIEEAQRRNCGLVQLTTDVRRPEALRFYERLGFEASHHGMKLLLPR